MAIFSKQTKLVLQGNLLVGLMLLARLFLTHTNTYFFLIWNLFLAFVPLGVALVAQRYSPRPLLLLALTALWLVFFPNAPYLITDLSHLSHFKGMPLWYDALMLFAAAFTGVAMGFISLQIMERQWRQLWQHSFFKNNGTTRRWRYRLATIAFVFLLTGFGLYLGRVARWNSWDLLTETGSLATDIGRRIFRPAQHKSTWFFTGVYGTVLFFLYNAWCSIRSPRTKHTGE